jgi:hypothetical protein
MIKSLQETQKEMEESLSPMGITVLALDVSHCGTQRLFISTSTRDEGLFDRGIVVGVTSSPVDGSTVPSTKCRIDLGIELVDGWERSVKTYLQRNRRFCNALNSHIAKVYSAYKLLVEMEVNVSLQHIGVGCYTMHFKDQDITVLFSQVSPEPGQDVSAAIEYPDAFLDIDAGSIVKFVNEHESAKIP